MRQDVVDVLATSRMDLVRALIGLPPFAVHRWRIATKAVLAMIFFKSVSQQESKSEIATSLALVSCLYIIYCSNQLLTLCCFLASNKTPPPRLIKINN